MKITISGLAALGLATLAQPVAAQPAASACGVEPATTPPGADAPALARAAHDLASLYYPEDMITAVVERQSRIGFEQGVRQSPGGERVLTEMPQIVDVGYDATMGIIRPCVAVVVPVLQQRAAAILGRRLTLTQLRDVSAFYRSDAGRATMASIIETMRPPQPRLRPDGTVEPMTRADIRTAVQPNFLDRMSPAQIAALEAFGSSPHGRAFMAATPELEQTTVATVNAMNAATQPRVEAAVRAAIEAHIRRNPPPRRPN